jgi:UDP-sugar transporter A1/2/3
VEAIVVVEGSTPSHHPHRRRKDVEAAAPPAASKPPMLFGIELRYLVCGMLVIQNTGAVLLMRYTRSMPGEGQYITQTAVIMQELIKGIACILLLLKDEGTLSSAWAKPGEALKTSVPALLYLVQNNLQYVAVGYLDAATYTVSYQSKIIWSGMLSVLLLGRRLGPHKWLGILLLAAGVAAVQIAGSQQAASQGHEDSAGKAVGLVAIILAAMVSALAGVYFEKILKGAKVGLWTRNLQLAFYSVLVGYGKLASSPQGEALRAGRTSFFFGYTKMTWCCVALNAFGGLLVGTVIKYADAVMKDVALGSSIVCSSLASVYLFDFELNASFAAGIACVIYSVFLYGQRAHCCGALSPPEG